MIIYNSFFLLRLNVCNDLAKAMKALDGKKVLVLNRIQLFRQVFKEIPALSQFFFDGLLLHSRRPRRGYRLLVTALDALGWTYVGDGFFMDIVGRVFHVCLTPVQHNQALLLSAWTGKVASQVRGGTGNACRTLRTSVCLFHR